MISVTARHPPEPNPCTAAGCTISTRIKHSHMSHKHKPRAAMSMFILRVAPASADPSAKKATHSSRIGFLPKIDTRVPHSGITAVPARE